MHGLQLNGAALFVLAAALLSATTVSAADLKIATKAPAAAPSIPWDVAFGATLVSDYYFRGITQSNHKPSVWTYFEPRYNVVKDLQLYAGIAGESISFPNRAAAEIDLYAGIRPTFDKLTLDFGVWYYWYPGGQCFHNLSEFRARLRDAGSPAERQRSQSRPEFLGGLRQGHLHLD
jgi:uncharacterized protein (TIGR02001 family)